MEVLDFYSGLLGAAGMKVNDAGEVYIVSADTKTVLTISGQTLMLPTRELLAAGLKEDQIAFHPACEGIARKESMVLKRYRKVLQYRLNWVLAEVLSQLMEIAVNSDRHSALSPNQREYLTLMATADKKTLEALEKVLSKVNIDKVDRRLVSTYIVRPGILKGKEYPRVAVVIFPLLQAAQDAEPSIFGVKMRQKDKDSIIKLFLNILPKADELGEYSFGTNDMTAPNLYSLVMASVGLFEKINDKVNLYEDQFEDVAELKTDLGFVAGIESLAKYRALIPEQRGNAGEKLDGKDDDELKPAAPAPVEKKRIQIAFPGPEKDRPQAPAQPQYREPAPTAQRAYQDRGYEQHPAQRAPQEQRKPTEKPDWRDLGPKEPLPPAGGYYDPRYAAPAPIHYPPPHEDPRYAQPQYHDPRYAQPPVDPRYHDPRYAQPQYREPGVSPGRAAAMAEERRRYHDPRYAQPQYVEPYYQGGPHGSQYYR